MDEFKKKADELCAKQVMDLAKELTTMRGGSTLVGGPGSVHIVIAMIPLTKPDEMSPMLAAEWYSVFSSFGSNPAALLDVGQVMTRMALEQLDAQARQENQEAPQ